MDKGIRIPTFVTGPTNENYFKCAKYPIIYKRLHFADPLDPAHFGGEVKQLREVLWQVFTAAQMKQALEDTAFEAIASALATWGMTFVPTMLPSQKPPEHEYPDATAVVNGELYDVEITRVSPVDASGTNVETYSSLMSEDKIIEPRLSPVLYCHHQRHQTSNNRCPRWQYISESQVASDPFHDPDHRSFVLLQPRFAAELFPDLLGDVTRWYTPVALLPDFEITPHVFRSSIGKAFLDKREDVRRRSTADKTLLVIMSQSFSPSDQWVEKLNLQSRSGIDVVVLADLSGYIGMIHDGRAAKVIKTSMVKCGWCKTPDCNHQRILTVFQEFGGNEETANNLGEYGTMDDAMMTMLQARVTDG